MLKVDNFESNDLIEMVCELDEICGKLSKFECWKAIDDVNELAAEMRCVLEDRGIEV